MGMGQCHRWNRHLKAICPLARHRTLRPRHYPPGRLELPWCWWVRPGISPSLDSGLWGYWVGTAPAVNKLLIQGRVLLPVLHLRKIGECDSILS